MALLPHSGAGASSASISSTVIVSVLLSWPEASSVTLDMGLRSLDELRS